MAFNAGCASTKRVAAHQTASSIPKGGLASCPLLTIAIHIAVSTSFFVDYGRVLAFEADRPLMHRPNG